MLEIVSIGMMDELIAVDRIFFSLFQARSFHYLIFVWGRERRFNPIEYCPRGLEVVDELVYFC